MPSQWSNLNFRSKRDLSTWKDKCAEQRKIAKQWPAYDKRMITCEEYQFAIGPWHLVFCLEIFSKPAWVGSASIQEEVAYETVTGAHGEKFEVPQDALLAVSSWHSEHFEQARFILAEVFGDILRPGDKHQPALEKRGLMTLQWVVPYEGERFWLKNMN